MSRVIQILCQVVITFSIVSSLQNRKSAMDIRQPFRGAMCEKLRESVRECRSTESGRGFLRCLLLKVTGMSDMAIFQLSTENCYTNTEHARIPETRTRGYRYQQKGTVKRRKNPDCKRHDYQYVRAGRDRIYIKHHREHRTWDEALKICRSEGGMLAVLNSKEKEHAIMERNPLCISGVETVWIGMRDIGQNNTFVWIDGSPLSYFNWFEGKPDHVRWGKDMDCVRVVTHAHFLKRVYEWSADECTEKKAYFCQCF